MNKISKIVKVRRDCWKVLCFYSTTERDTHTTHRDKRQGNVNMLIFIKEAKKTRLFPKPPW